MTAPKLAAKPGKPYPEFPLSPNNRGGWSKKFKGKVYSFGRWEDPQAALREWEEFRNKHELGEPVPSKPTTQTIRTMCKAFLSAKLAKVEAGELGSDTWAQYEGVAKWLCTNMGEHRRLSSIEPEDFTRLRAKMPKHWSPTSVKNHVNIIRGICKWAFENAVIERPMRYGDNFSKPPEKVMRKHKRSKPKKFFDATEAHTLIDGATVQMKAMILLGMNCGYGNSDCARLRLEDVQGVWLRVPRGKNENDRKAWLWPETRRAIKAAIESRPTPKPGFEDLVFITQAGQEWVRKAGPNNGKRDAVAQEFEKLKDFCGIQRERVGFYAFRHVFETVAGECPGITNLQAVVDCVMGHDDGSMASNYREDVSDGRVKKVCEHVRQWYLSGAPKKRRKSKKTSG